MSSEMIETVTYQGCVFFTYGSENVSDFDEAVSFWAYSCWQTVQKHGEQVAQWYVYWEALDIRKNRSGCCWNVRTIDRKHGHQFPYLNTNSFIHTCTRNQTPSIRLLLREKITAMHGTRRCHSFYEFNSTWEDSQSHMREFFFFFLGTAKAIRCSSQQRQTYEKSKTHFRKPQKAKMNRVFNSVVGKFCVQSQTSKPWFWTSTAYLWFKWTNVFCFNCVDQK